MVYGVTLIVVFFCCCWNSICLFIVLLPLQLVYCRSIVLKKDTENTVKIIDATMQQLMRYDEKKNINDTVN